MIKISIATDFAITPGARKKEDGDFSGELFRERFLEPIFTKSKDEKVEINLDGVEGYSTAFLEEVFGGLARKFGINEVEKRISFISNEEEFLIDEIKEYIKKAKDK
jgi:hypothetical protein